MKPMLTACVLLAVGGWVASLCGHAADPPDVNGLMRKKLQAAQKVLEGIAVTDYDLIGKHAQDLILISKAAEWKVLATPEYELYSSDLRRAAQAIAKSAKEKNIDGAALGYVDLTLACVKCHKHVREVRTASRGLDSRAALTPRGE